MKGFLLGCLAAASLAPAHEIRLERLVMRGYWRPPQVVLVQIKTGRKAGTAVQQFRRST